MEGHGINHNQELLRETSEIRIGSSHFAPSALVTCAALFEETLVIKIPRGVFGRAA